MTRHSKLWSYLAIALLLVVSACAAGCALSGAELNLFEEPRVAMLTRPAPSVTDDEWRRGCVVQSQDEAKHVFAVRCPNERGGSWTETRYCIAAEPIDVVKRHWKKGWLVGCDVLK